MSTKPTKRPFDPLPYGGNYLSPVSSLLFQLRPRQRKARTGGAFGKAKSYPQRPGTSSPGDMTEGA